MEIKQKKEWGKYYGRKEKDEDKLSLWEKSKLGRKTKAYKIKTWLSRLVSLIILIVLLLLGKTIGKHMIMIVL